MKVQHFYGCESLSEITIPESVSKIGEGAFGMCGLERIVIPGSVKTISCNMFGNCENLSSVVIKEGVEIIDTYAFSFCTNLVKVTMPSTVKRINECAFKEDYRLLYITIPKSTEYVSPDAFTDCYLLKSINLDPDNKKFTSKNGQLWDKTGTELIIAPEGSDARIEELTISDEADITEYYEGDTFRTNGMTFEGKFINEDIDEDIYVYNLEEYLGEYITPTNIDRKGLKADQDNVTMRFTYGDSYAEAKQEISVKPKVVTKIAVKTKPSKKEYFEGETLDTTGLALTATYNDGTTKTISEGFECSGYDANKTGEQTITVTYGGKTATFKVTVSKVELSSIEVKTNPKITEYYVGDELNTEGLVLIATYGNGETKEIQHNAEGIVYSPKNITKTGELTITVTYGGKEATFTVKVKQRLDITINDYKVETENEIDYIINIKPETTVGKLKEEIKTNGSIIVSDKVGEKTDNKKLATGNKIKIILDEQEKEYIIVVKGDIIGDGIIDTKDLLKMARYQANLDNNLNGEYLKAADIYEDNNYADIKDILKMARILAGLDSF